MQRLLLINIPEEQIPSISNSLDESHCKVDCLSLGVDQQIQQETTDNSDWDAVIFSSSSFNSSLLQSVINYFDNTPVIFFSEDISERMFTDAIDSGCIDCLSSDTLYRLPHILKRETSSLQQINSSTGSVSPEILLNIINRSTDQVFLFDTTSLKCCFANKTAGKSLQYSQSVLQEMTPSDIYSEYSHNSLLRLITPLLQKERKQITLCTNIRRNRGVIYPCKVLFTTISSKDTSYLLAINKDISDTWYKVRKLKRQRAQTKSFLSKYKQKQELLANAAHDMRTSLQSIILSNKLLFDKQSGDFQKGYDKFQKAIHFSGKHLLNYINEFFDPSSDTNTFSSSTSDSLDVTAFTEKLFLVFKPIAQRNDIDFNLEISQLSHQYISANETYLKRILKNLLANAFKFTNQGRVSVHVYSVSAQKLDRTLPNTSDIIAFEVEDTGIGIPEDQQKTIFGRHNRTKNKKSGSGLGLHICQQLTESLNGKIKVRSEVGNGSTFTLYLPAQKNTLKQLPHPNNTNGSQGPANAILNQDKTILIIDDSEVHNLALNEYLSYTFDSCLSASSLPKAKDILKENTVDCIVSDFTIYSNNCLDFLTEVCDNQHYKNISAIVYTGKKLSKSEKRSISNCADAIVKKNTGSYEELTNTIISLFRKKHTINSSITKGLRRP